jgi:hypothetical protein
MPHNVALFVGRLGIYVVSAAAFALLVVAVVIVGFAALVNGSTEPPIETTIARYADALKAIGAGVRLPINQGPGQPHDALPRLATMKENIRTAELIPRDVEQQLATKASGCIFAKAAGDAIEERNPTGSGGNEKFLGCPALRNEGSTEQPNQGRYCVWLGRVAWQSRARNSGTATFRSRHRDHHGQCRSRLHTAQDQGNCSE